MPKNNYHPLPDFSSLIRWTVQDVINWLEKNKLSSCGKLFRDAGIDGNKLYNSTEADLIGINCPKRELSIIVDLLKQAQPQKGRGYKQPNSTPKAPPRPAATITNNDEASGSEDDCGWSDTEFSDEDDDGQNGDSDSSYEQPISEPAPPVRPSRPGGSSQPAHPPPSRPRPPPPTPQESAPEVPPPRPGMRPIAQPSEEFYEEPNNDVPSRPTFAQPPLPGSRDRPPRPGERNPVPQTPPRGGRGPLPQPEEEMYEDPDEGTKGPQKPKFKAPAPPGVQNQEDYEEPDSKLQPAPRPPLPRIPPAPSEEDYVETDTPAPSVVARSRRPPAPIPTPSPVVDDQEDYDQPDVGFTRTNKDSNQKHSTPSAPSGVGKKEHRSRNDPLPRPPQAQSPIVPPQSRQAPRSTMPKSEDDESDLERQKWFHGDIKRASAAARLMQYKTDGMYLIRKSSQGKDKPYTLQIWYQDKDYNLPIRIVPHNKQYAIGAERPGERTFPTLRAMVNFFKKNFLVLAGGGQTTLVKSLPR